MEREDQSKGGLAALVADAEQDPTPRTEASSKPTSGPRVLRVDVGGTLHDWFDVEEMSDFIRSQAFVGTLRENVARYFGVAVERQAIYDEDGLLTTSADFSRALQRVAPKLYVYDVNEMAPELRERTVEELQALDAEVEHSWRHFGVAARRTRPSQVAHVANGALSLKASLVNPESKLAVVPAQSVSTQSQPSRPSHVLPNSTVEAKKVSQRIEQRTAAPSVEGTSQQCNSSQLGEDTTVDVVERGASTLPSAQMIGNGISALSYQPQVSWPLQGHAIYRTMSPVPYQAGFNNLDPAYAEQRHSRHTFTVHAPPAAGTATPPLISVPPGARTPPRSGVLMPQMRTVSRSSTLVAASQIIRSATQPTLEPHPDQPLQQTAQETKPLTQHPSEQVQWQSGTYYQSQHQPFQQHLQLQLQQIPPMQLIFGPGHSANGTWQHQTNSTSVQQAMLRAGSAPRLQAAPTGAASICQASGTSTSSSHRALTPVRMTAQPVWHPGSATNQPTGWPAVAQNHISPRPPATPPRQSPAFAWPAGSPAAPPLDNSSTSSYSNVLSSSAWRADLHSANQPCSVAIGPVPLSRSPRTSAEVLATSGQAAATVSSLLHSEGPSVA